MKEQDFKGFGFIVCKETYLNIKNMNYGCDYQLKKEWEIIDPVSRNIAHFLGEK